MSSGTGSTFTELFRKYRLLSQFSTLSSLCEALQAEGLTYDPSILSHWQNGKRVPADRALILILIKIFIKHGGLTTLDQANELLESLQRGYLTEVEKIELFKESKEPLTQVFQVPRDIHFFVGRESYLSELQSELKGKVLLLSGLSGSGKTSLAIRLANASRALFRDGIVWLRLDTLSVYEALNHIGTSFGINLVPIKNLHAKAAMLRSHLRDKEVLIILDNVDKTENIELLFPNTRKASVIITSIYQQLPETDNAVRFEVEPFSVNESLRLFSAVLGRAYAIEHEKELVQVSHAVGYLPLAVNLIATQIKYHGFTPNELLTLFKEGNLSLDRFEYGGKNLFLAIELAISKIPVESRTVLMDLSVFGGEDFSIETIASLQHKQLPETKDILENLVSYSLVQHATGSRYKVHPLITHFCASLSVERNRLVLKELAGYFADFVTRGVDDFSLQKVVAEQHITVLLMNTYLQEKLYAEVLAVWEPFSRFLWETGRWQLLSEWGDMMVNIAKEVGDLRLAALLLIRERSWFFFWRGNSGLAKTCAIEGLQLATQINDQYLIAFAQQRLGVMLSKEGDTHQALEHLQQALATFINQEKSSHVGDTYLYLGHVHRNSNNLDQVIKCYQKALDIATEISDRKAESIANCYLGTAYLEANNLELAEAYHAAALTIDKTIESKSGEAFNLVGLAKVKFAQSNFDQCADILKEAREVSQKLELLDLLKEIDAVDQQLSF